MPLAEAAGRHSPLRFLAAFAIGAALAREATHAPV